MEKAQTLVPHFLDGETRKGLGTKLCKEREAAMQCENDIYPRKA